jgi:hypothetical protein
MECAKAVLNHSEWSAEAEEREIRKLLIHNQEFTVPQSVSSEKTMLKFP